MAKSRSIVSGPRWPGNMSRTLAPAHLNPGTLDALDERLIFIGQIQSDDGATHSYDTLEFRVQSSTLDAAIG